MVSLFLSKLKIRFRVLGKRFREKYFLILKRGQKFFARKTLLVLGDSHAKIFNHWLFIREFPQVYFDVCSITGATASGMDNPNSKTQAAKIFFNQLNKKCYDAIIVLLGEVDAGFVIWYRAQKYQMDVNSMLMQTVQVYSNFLEKVSRFRKTIVLSAPMPTIQDQNDWGEIANLRKEIMASQKQRTELTLQMNNAMRTFCENNGIIYVNLDQLSLGADGFVKSELRNRDPKNHHYDDRQYAKLIIESFNRADICDLLRT